MILVVTGPSGAGKTSLIRRLLDKHPEIEFSVSHTTRPPRPGEVNGRDYYFVSEATFSQLLKRDKFVEWAVVHGYHYGTSKSEFRKSRFGDLVLDIDIQGARRVKKVVNRNSLEAIFIFVLPPDKDSLEKRLLARGDLSTEELQRRLKRAQEEMVSFRQFDYLIINRKLEVASLELEAIILAEHCRGEKKRKEVQNVLNSFKAKRPRR